MYTSTGFFFAPVASSRDEQAWKFTYGIGYLTDRDSTGVVLPNSRVDYVIQYNTDPHGGGTDTTSPIQNLGTSTWLSAYSTTSMQMGFVEQTGFLSQLNTAVGDDLDFFHQSGVSITDSELASYTVGWIATDATCNSLTTDEYNDHHSYTWVTRHPGALLLVEKKLPITAE